MASYFPREPSPPPLHDIREVQPGALPGSLTLGQDARREKPVSRRSTRENIAGPAEHSQPGAGHELDQEVREALVCVLSSPHFARARTLSRFLRFVVEQTLAGKADELKEYTIGFRVFERGENFDPRIDPIVRVQAGKLRDRLDRYYREEGAGAGFRIALRPGSYVPVFEPRVQESGSTVAVFRSGRVREPETPTLAVLPFLNLTGDPEFEYFTDGISEELIGLVGLIPRLRVIARTSSFSFKGVSATLAGIGRKLSANLILEGSVRRSADAIRVTARLNEAATEHQIWTRHYDGRLEDVFGVQDEIAAKIAETVRGTPHVRQASQPAVLESHLLLLRGWHIWNKCDYLSMGKALQHFERAAAADPDNAKAHAAVALGLTLLCVYDLISSREAAVRASEAVRRALECGGESADSWGAKGCVESTLLWNWSESEKAYERALAINPNHTVSRHGYAIGGLMALGRFEEVFREMRLVLELDPLSAMANCDLATAHTYAGMYEEALELYRSALEVDPQNLRIRVEFGWCMLQAGRVEEGLKAIEDALVGVSIPPFEGMRALGLALAGRRGEALEKLDWLRTAYGDGRLHFNSPVFALDALGLREEALAEFEHAYDRRDTHLRLVNINPRAELLRGEPRFQALIRRMGLAGAAEQKSAQNR